MTDLVLYSGDCLDILDQLPANHFDAAITDPPYHLKSIVERFGSPDAKSSVTGKNAASNRMSRRFKGKTWDGGEISFQPETWMKVLRVLKPGAYLAAFNHARTFHHMAIALEAAGFEYRETLYWIYSQGLPQNHPQDKALRRLVESGLVLSEDQIAEWEGWGTVLKPAVEPIALVRKPLSERSIARQCLATGTGAINVRNTATPSNDDPDGTRYPTNLIHDGSPDVLARFPLIGGASVSRFFYCAKATKADRQGSDHPTVKPQALMRWLLKLLVKPGARVLDPFGGSGSTGWAAHSLGVHASMIERDADYQADIARGIAEIQVAPPLSAQDGAAKPAAKTFLDLLD